VFETEFEIRVEIELLKIELFELETANLQHCDLKVGLLDNTTLTRVSELLAKCSAFLGACMHCHR